MSGPARKRIDAGTMFGRLEFLREIETPPAAIRRALFRCSCGNEFEARIPTVKNGHTKSCGCLVRSMIRDRNMKHGAATVSGKTSEYNIWVAMRQRCNDPRSTAYPDYGGRGIKVCPRWDDFAAFLSDMGHRPSRAHSIERRNANGDYGPDNCEWATRVVQANNKRNNVFIEWQGKTLTAPQWAHETGIPASAIAWRIRRGWSVERALTAPAFSGRNQFSS